MPDSKRRGCTWRLLPNSRLSQTTVFMILGLIILVGGIVFFYSTKNIQKALEPEIKIIQEDVPSEFMPIKEYAASCARSVGVEGLKIIGQQGGYISFTDKALNRETFTIAQNPTESDAVSFTKNSELKIPYWWYLKSANNCNSECRFESKRSELRQSENSIEKQLERFIDLKFADCIKGFEDFAEQGFKVTDSGKIKSDVVIGKEDVAIVVEYPIIINKGNAEAKLSQFFVEIPINLDRIYDLATKITNLEIKHRYFEKYVLNLIVAFSGIDKDKLPPMSDLQFKFGSTMSWQKSDVKSRITGLLSSYVPLFQVDGTYNYERNIFDSELKQRLYDSSIIPIANSSFRNLAAYFTYLDFWPAYFNLNCNGEKCIPSSANSLISDFGVQTYKFAYDLSFPVLVEVKDPFALNGKGYTFNFFLEGNIRDNKPMPTDFAELGGISLPETSLLCEAKTSGNITVTAKSASTKQPIENANVLYSIIDESCFIGSTDSNGILKENFPAGVVGGVINLAKDGYIGKAVEFDPTIGKDESLDVEIQPIYRKKVIIKKKRMIKTQQGWQFVDKEAELSPKESAFITLKRISGKGELEFSSVLNYEGKQNEPSEIEIAPGDYSADITLSLNERIIIPEKQKCVSKGILVEKECFTIPKIDFGEKSPMGREMFSEGGLKLNFTINANELEKHSTIVLYAISIDLANVTEKNRVIEDIEQLGKIEEYSTIYDLALQPSFQ